MINIVTVEDLDLALLTLSWDKNWDNHSLVNGYPSFYPRIALVAPSPGDKRREGEAVKLKNVLSFKIFNTIYTTIWCC